MVWIAIRMLTGDRVKFIGLVFGVAFSTLLITQQLTIFINLVTRGGSAAYEAAEANIWVMDEASRTPDVVYAMPATSLERVRGVEGVAWAVPLLRANALVRTAAGDLEAVSIVGVDDTTLIGLPRRMLRGDRSELAGPDAVFIDDVGAERMLPPGTDPVGVTLELNDQRAVIRGVADSNPTFTSAVTLFTRYSNALRFVPGTRNRMSFIVARSAPGVDPATVIERIERQTGLKARSTDDFARDGVQYIIENTGIPVNFGITVALGVIVGVAIVGLTFSLFIRDNIKQFGALKAIGVTNGTIRRMVAAQAGLVALIGYGLGVAGATGFIFWSETWGGFFKNFYTPWEIPLVAAVAVIVMILLTGVLALRSVLKTDPAEVFR